MTGKAMPHTHLAFATPYRRIHSDSMAINQMPNKAQRRLGLACYINARRMLALTMLP
jgi:hypothetical protein